MRKGSGTIQRPLVQLLAFNSVSTGTATSVVVMGVDYYDALVIELCC